jgi:uncharacterized membrane protein SirB2
MTAYASAKLVHIVCVLLSLAGFVGRYLWARRGARRLTRPLARVVPHVNDTVLLAAGIAMLWLARSNPWALPWLRAKIAALILYVVLGAIALRHDNPPRLRTLCFAAALLAFGYITTAAVTKTPLGAIAWVLR